MPILFRCHNCNRRLSVGSHKAGKQVLCPKCDAELIVPSAEDQAAAAAMAGAPPVDDDPAEAYTEFYFEDAPADEPAPRPTTSDETGPVPDFNPELVSISRRALYAQGVLIAVVGLIAFVLGYILGGAGEPAGKSAAAPVGPVLFEGRLTYKTSTGETRDDGGSVVIVLPRDAFPDEKIPIDGLGPEDELPDDDAQPIRAIASLGGVYQRTNDRGEFQFEVASPGKYYVLLLSNQTRRPSDVHPEPGDLAGLGRFFETAPDLLGQRKYVWEIVEIAEASTLAHNFGRTGR